MPIPRLIPIPRREFLAPGAAGALVSGNPLGPTGPAVAADPVIRAGSPLLKLSLAGYSFHSFLPRRGSPEQIAAARMKLEDFIHFCAEQGLGATELTGYYFP